MQNIHYYLFAVAGSGAFFGARVLVSITRKMKLKKIVFDNNEKLKKLSKMVDQLDAKVESIKFLKKEISAENIGKKAALDWIIQENVLEVNINRVLMESFMILNERNYFYSADFIKKIVDKKIFVLQKRLQELEIFMQNFQQKSRLEN